MRRGDVTAQHYNTHPELVKKRAMMRAWIGWLEKQEAAAVAADPVLLDREAMAEQIYRIRYGEDVNRHRTRTLEQTAAILCGKQ